MPDRKLSGHKYVEIQILGSPVLATHANRVQLEGAIKKLELPNPNSDFSFQKPEYIFNILVPLNLEPELTILVLGPA